MLQNIKRFFTLGHKIQRYSPGTPGFGGDNGEWENHLEVPGRLRPLSGDERMSADKMTLYATHRFYTDVADIKESDRYIDPGGKVYEIKFVADPMNMGEFLQIDLEEHGHAKKLS